MSIPNFNSKRKSSRRPGQRDNRISPGDLIEYQQHGNTHIAVVEKFAEKKWKVLTENNERISLQADRIFKVPASLPVSNWPDSQKVAFLKQFALRADRKISSIKLEDVWTKAKEHGRAQSAEDLCQKVFGNDNALTLLALRRRLFQDRVFFKRKGPLFEAFSEEIVTAKREEQRRLEEEKKLLEELITALVSRLDGSDSELGPKVFCLEETAALGSKATKSSEARFVIESIEKQGKFNPEGNLNLKAKKLLQQVGHFGEHPNLSVIRHGVSRNYPETLTTEENLSKLLEVDDAANRADYTHLYCLTIDDASTLDRDDALSLEQTEKGLRVGIHISDVSSYVSDNESPILREAISRASSIYCPGDIIHMLPPCLSEDRLSLKADEERRAISHFVEIDTKGELLSYSLERTSIKVKENLSYEDANKILCDEDRASSEAAIALKNLWEVAGQHEMQRSNNGAVQFNRRDSIPALDDSGKVILKAATDETPGFKLVSEMMILANNVAARFAKEKNLPILFRGQETPENLDFINDESVEEGPAREYFFRSQMKPSAVSVTPSSHCGLGLSEYAQVTSPIRRASDLLNQLQISRTLDDQPAFFTAEELTNVYSEAQLNQPAVNSVQNERQRYWLIKYFEQEQIKQFSATIVKVVGPKPIAELEITCSTLPFRPAGNEFSGRLGQKVELEIEDLSSEKERLRLMEKGAPKVENKKNKRGKKTSGSGKPGAKNKRRQSAKGGRSEASGKGQNKRKSSPKNPKKQAPSQPKNTKGKNPEKKTASKSAEPKASGPANPGSLGASILKALDSSSTGKTTK